MVTGLAVAAIIPCAAFWLLLRTGADHGFAGMMIDIAEVAGCGAAWFIGLGSLFLMWASRTDGVVSRFKCLALCAILTFSMPFFLVLLSTAVNPSTGSGEIFYPMVGCAFVGLVATPVNLIGGWLLWCIAFPAASASFEEMA